jgi:hypothetical protein
LPYEPTGAQPTGVPLPEYSGNGTPVPDALPGWLQLAFGYRDTAEKERQFKTAAGPPQLAFVFRNRAEKERQFKTAAGAVATGVRLPE